MKHLQEYIIESSSDKFFTEEEKGKILHDMWDKNGQFYKFLKDKVDSLSAININQYFDDLSDDDRMLPEFASYIESVIGRNNFSLKQVKRFINTEDLKG